MNSVRGWKTLRADGSSLSDVHRIWYPLPHDGQAGAWITVPGNGCYVADEIGDDLFWGGVGDILVAMECRDQVRISFLLSGIRCWREVRILEIVPWTSIPPWEPRSRYLAAAFVPSLSLAEREELVLRIPLEKTGWRYAAACFVPGLSDSIRAELAPGISPGEIRPVVFHGGMK